MRWVAADAEHELAHCLVHVRAILEHLAHGRARDEPAHRATVPLARLHVVRVEQIRVSRIRRHIFRRMRAEDERLEEPARMREMPLRRAHVGHAADDVILGIERLAQTLRLRAHRFESLGERKRSGGVAFGARTMALDLRAGGEHSDVAMGAWTWVRRRALILRGP